MIMLWKVEDNSIVDCETNETVARLVLGDTGEINSGIDQWLEVIVSKHNAEIDNFIIKLEGGK